MNDLKDPEALPLESVPSTETSPLPQPQSIGRYRIQKVLGEGGFGLVYLAHDEQLSRLVAVKVPHARLLRRPKDAEAYLNEARAVASLDHPNIVPVFDVGSTEQFPYFVVSKYVDGTDLAKRPEFSRLSVDEAVELVATVAEALHHAHKQGLVHRDIKPGNILLDRKHKPFITDFGLALREHDVGTGPHFVGTPAYMSPEQARGEGHRVDGRSDIFSLGVVLYELLTGQRPFNANSVEERREQIACQEVRPLRQYDDTIPKELERICLRALVTRVSDRYSTAKDLADDLRHWLGTAGRGKPDSDNRLLNPELPAAKGVIKDVFLSYASSNKETADRLCCLLEEQQVRCWIAPRDVPPGDNFGEAIVHAIEAATTIFLLLSADANASPYVLREVERATSKRKRVIPIRLEDILPGPSLELHLASAQWVDAWSRPLDQVALQLAEAIRKQGSRTATPSGLDTPSPIHSVTPSHDGRPLKIVPKGLRSFDAHDADFFLELLPGPRDRDGLPDSIRFWKTRIEETDPDKTFSVGLIYGPSGCGKSSLMKAGLLPRLARSVMAIYIEATADETEVRLLKALRKQIPDLPNNLDLVETLAALRQGRFAAFGQMVLLVLDQFEQWLHAKKEEDNTELVKALRQCDGSKLQCIVMVRDDFWMAATRFMRELEIHLLEGQNSAAVDLFPIRHAQKVLAAFGLAFGILPDGSTTVGKEQKQFIRQAVSGLAQDSKVVCVRLALFAEMMKGRAWTPATLREVGGTEGVGVTFLEETFTAATAPPEHRYHQKAARAVLKALLPAAGTDIKGHLRSYAELLEASGYGTRPKDFFDLIHVLDSEIRLITPTDPEGNEGTGDSASQAKTGEKYYQLTHDYLVHSLREWLTHKQRETRKGRSELRLAERSTLWNIKPENRYLPSLREFLNITLLTDRKTWTAPQRKMMGRAGRVYGMFSGIVAALLLVASIVGLSVRNWAIERQYSTHAEGLVHTLVNADISQVPAIVVTLEQYQNWAEPLLKAAADKVRVEPTREGYKQRLNVALALLPMDATQVEYLYNRLLKADPDEFLVIRDALASHQDELLDRLWALLRNSSSRDARVLPAAAALAQYVANDPRWNEVSRVVAERLVDVSAVIVDPWKNALRPVRAQLLAPLVAIYSDPVAEGGRTQQQRELAAYALTDYGENQPEVLAELLMRADQSQFTMVFPIRRFDKQRTIEILAETASQRLTTDPTDPANEILAKRQANATVALFRFGDTKDVWPRLRHSSDPRVRSYIINRLGPLGADPQPLVDRLGWSDISIRCALILALGEFDASQLPKAKRTALADRLLPLYRGDPNPGLHGAIEWLLRNWGFADRLQAIDDDLAGKPPGERRWYVNGQKQTMVLIQGPIEFQMGSPPRELDREGGPNDVERLHIETINRSFAIASHEVTIADFLRFRPKHSFLKQYASFTGSLNQACPMTSIAWADAPEYCNWLSAQEGIAKNQWCYEPNAAGVYAETEDHLHRTGYRLPTEAEWEFACRAGASTSRYYGETAELLSRYAWNTNNSQDRRLLPVGSLKPNDLGLFDMYGNAAEWCERGSPSNDPAQGRKNALPVSAARHDVLRGGSFYNRAAYIRSAFRLEPAVVRSLYFGFRTVRTCP